MKQSMTPAVAVGTVGYPTAPGTDPGVQYSRTGLLNHTHFRRLSDIPRKKVCLCVSGPTLSGIGCLCGLRMTVIPFPM